MSGLIESSEHRVILSTAPSAEVATSLTTGALEKRLAACVQQLPGMQSHYWWDGAIQSDQEILLLFKTHIDQTEALAQFIKEAHPYDTPELIEIPITKGSQSYLDWITENVNGT